MPRVDMLATRSTVPVWTGAAYAARSASNPAWACYDILHQARYKGTGGVTLAASYDVLGVPASRIDYNEFVSWAGWCMDPGRDVAPPPDPPLGPHTCNIYLDTPMSLRKALDMVGACGRGVVVQIGTKFTPIVDRPEKTPVQRFLLTPGNIAADSFQEQFLPMHDRANSVEVTYYDADQDYTRQTLEVYASDFDTSDREINKASVTLVGVTNRQKATDYARFLINSNRYLTNTISIEADVDSIVCLPGDVIEVAHDVPQWGYGGRIVSATASGATLDRSVTLAPATVYHIMVKHQDDDSREERVIADAAGTYTTLSLTVAWTKIPAAHAVYSVGEVDHVVKEFRVLRIGTGQDLRRKIAALEYLQEVYEDGVAIPPPESDSDLPWVTALTAIEVYRGGTETKVYLKWRGFALYWNISYRKGDDGKWNEYKRVYTPSCDIGGLDYGVLYTFAVSHTEDLRDGETVSITLRGKLDPPGTVPSITATELHQDYAVRLEWVAVTDFDLWGYELRVETIWESYPYPTFSANWIAATMLFKGNALSFTWTYKVIGAYCFHVRAVDAFGNYSTISTTTIVDIGAADAPEGSYAFSGPNAVLSWSVPDSSFAIDHYDISYGDAYSSAVAVGTTKGTTFSINATWGGMRRYWIVAVDVAGNTGDPGSVDVIVAFSGGITSPTPRVIDNNVLLQWTAPTGWSLPIKHYLVSKGSSYAPSVDIGQVLSTFFVVFETVSGEYIYWIVPVDTAGNEGTPVGISVTVNQPPDYILLQNWLDDFSGTKVSAFLEGGKLYAPVNITETYQQHFVNNSYDSPQEQVDAGFTAWIMPVPNSATYTRVFNYGASITPSTKITLEVGRDEAAEWGTTTITATLEVSTDGIAWDTPVAGYERMASVFQYVRVTLSFAGTGNNDIAVIMSIRVKLDLKQITDAGRAEVATNGVQVNFNKTFIDVVSITVAPEATTSTLAVYDFTDVPNPTHFHIYLFNPATGADASGSGKYVSWTARGV
jgi:predicted phage tail protein